MANKQLIYWKGDFGREYTERVSNLDFFSKRRNFFKTIIGLLDDLHSVLEIGCNMGGNIVQLNAIDPRLKISAIEPNSIAAQKARQLNPQSKIIKKSVYDINWKNEFDLVFTAGVLIHIAPTYLQLAMEKIYQASRRYILSIEYYSTSLTPIPYRGLKDGLFKGPYDKLWINQFKSLQLVHKGKLNHADGFDNCRWWLFVKR